jgi:putative ABC transport system substrate-binding protein
MRRRDLLAYLGAASAFCPLAAAAQQTKRGYRIGVLAQNNLQPGLLDAFRAGLLDLGYIEGDNIAIELCDAAGHNDRLAGLVQDLLSRKVEVILAVNTPAAQAAKKATSSVPTVIMRVADPVKSGLIASLARSGGNVTGMYFMLHELGVKGLDLLHEIAPGISRVGILYQADNPASSNVASATEASGAKLGFQFSRLPVKEPGELREAFERAARARIEALFVIDDGTITKQRHEIVTLAGKHSLPVVSIYKDFAESGGLIAYGPSLDIFYRHAAYYVDKILKGAAPSDLPVERPARFDLLVNLKAAKALGLTVPQSLLARADEVIE